MGQNFSGWIYDEVTRDVCCRFQWSVRSVQSAALVMHGVVFTIVVALLVINSTMLSEQGAAYAQQEHTISAEEYLATLRQVSQLIAADSDISSLRQGQQRLLAITHVTLANGTTIAIQPLLGEETVALPTHEVAHARLAAAMTQIAAAIKADKADMTATQLAQLTAIFSQPEFVRQDSLWDRFWRWLRSWLPDTSAYEGTTNRGWFLGGISIIGWAIIGVGSMLLLFLLSMWLQQLLGNFVGGTATHRRLIPEGELLSAADARDQACQLAERGSFRAAVRRLYLAALLSLDERNLLQYDRSNTNREVLAAINNNPTLYHNLRPVIETFDDVWYGVHEPTQETFEEYVQAVDMLEKTT